MVLCSKWEEWVFISRQSVYILIISKISYSSEVRGKGNGRVQGIPFKCIENQDEPLRCALGTCLLYGKIAIKGYRRDPDLWSQVQLCSAKVSSKATAIPPEWLCIKDEPRWIGLIHTWSAWFSHQIHLPAQQTLLQLKLMSKNLDVSVFCHCFELIGQF